MNDLVNLFVNNGTAVVVLAYFLYRDYKFMNTLQTTLATLVKTVDALKENVENFSQLKKEEKRYGNDFTN